MPNTNCLEGWKCPECSSEGPFWIRGACITADVLMSDDGTIEENRDSTDWDPDSIAECANCGQEGCVRDFTNYEITLSDAVEGLEKEMIIEALKTTHGRCKGAAELLGVTERIFCYKAKKYDVDYRLYR